MDLYYNLIKVAMQNGERMMKLSEPNIRCDLYVNGACRKSMSGRARCEKSRSDESWFTDKLRRCRIDEVCRRDSIYGNRYFKLTRDDLEALERGEILYDLDEYGTFIMLEDVPDE